MKSFKQWLLEKITIASDDEYKEVLSNLYDSEFINFILSSDQMVYQLTGNLGKIEKNEYSDKKNNLFVKYSEGNGIVAILGFLSKTGRINRKDIIDVKKWMNKLESKIYDEFTIITSLNRFSKPFIKNIVNKLNLDVYSLGKHEFEQGTWETVIIVKKEKKLPDIFNMFSLTEIEL